MMYETPRYNMISLHDIDCNISLHAQSDQIFNSTTLLSKKKAEILTSNLLNFQVVVAISVAKKNRSQS